MRTTLTIDDDILEIARSRGRLDGRTAGQVISDLARLGLQQTLDDDEIQDRDGWPVLPSRGPRVTQEIVDRIRDEEGV